ncbi:MAG: hypothetical protein HKN23_03015 [Verrucomicrobiales bacterium]|nr:hypothetical protein [Verrucomicrobiales bacterium]
MSVRTAPAGLVIAFSAITLGTVFAQQTHPVRQWTSSEGRTLDASLVSADRNVVVLRLKNGRTSRIPIQNLSRRDQDHLAKLNRLGLAFPVVEMPEEVRVSGTIQVEGGPRLFQTEHFEFETDQGVSKSFISEAARVYEGTYLAVKNLPFHLELAPPDGNERYRGRFLTDANFRSAIGGKVETIPGQKVAGVYLPQRRELLVPYSSLGAARRGSQVTMNRSSDTSTLIHEVTHQLLHDWLPLIPTWMAEGLAESVASVPYWNGRFDFQKSEEGLKNRLVEKYSLDEEILHVGDMIRPSELIARRRVAGAPENQPRAITAGKKETPRVTRNSDSEWDGTLREYRDSLLLTWYFIHLDRPEAPGTPIAAYLKLVDEARNETDRFIVDYNEHVEEFEARRQAYNRQVKRYNEELEKFRLAVNRYNDRVREWNAQILDGVPESERTDLGAPPREPVRPVQLEIPEILEKTPNQGPVDLVRIVQEKAGHALIRDRSPDELDAALQTAYARMGISIQFED